MRVLLAGGGSAGHIEPALALADALRRVRPGSEVTCLGTERGLETRLIPLRGYPLELIPAVPMPRTMTPALLTVPGRLAGAVNAAAAVLDQTRAEALVGFGGYVATPAYLAARRANTSGTRLAIRSPAKASPPYMTVTHSVPTSPSSSPMMAKMKSLVDSGT